MIEIVDQREPVNMMKADKIAILKMSKKVSEEIIKRIIKLMKDFESKIIKGK